MPIILKDKVLDELVCSKCHKYLSVTPIKVYHDRTIRCGRCCANNDGGTVSFYNKIVQSYVFKCINRYEGCNKLLRTSSVVAHEKSCQGDSYNCPKCEISFIGSSLELVHHYKQLHPSSILNNNEFYVTPEKEVKERYLYIKENIVFFILLQYLYHENYLYISAVTLKPCKNIYQKFSVAKNDIYVETETKSCSDLQSFNCDYYQIETKTRYLEKIKCKFLADLPEDSETCYELVDDERALVKECIASAFTSVCIQALPEEDILGVQLTDNFKKEFPHHKLTPCGTALYRTGRKRLELTCSNCRQFTGANAFSCKRTQHVQCRECNAWCSVCDSSMDGWNAEISYLNQLILFPCRWKCGENFSGTVLTTHENECAKSFVTCPIETCGMDIFLRKCEKHFMLRHQLYDCMYPFNLTGYLNKLEKNSILYFVRNNSWFKLTWLKLGNSYEINIKSCDTKFNFEFALIANNTYYQKIVNNKLKVSIGSNTWELFIKQINNKISK